MKMSLSTVTLRNAGSRVARLKLPAFENILIGMFYSFSTKSQSPLLIEWVPFFHLADVNYLFDELYLLFSQLNSFFTFLVPFRWPRFSSNLRYSNYIFIFNLTLTICSQAYDRGPITDTNNYTQESRTRWD